LFLAHTLAHMAVVSLISQINGFLT
jgi:hypothetical protein